MNSLVLILGLAAVAMTGMTMLALRRARRAGARCLDLEQLIDETDQRLGEFELQVSQLTKIGKETARRVDRLAADQGRLASISEDAGFGEAIALIQQGASAEQLINTCGVGRAEARLVETLYGREKSPEPSNHLGASNKFILVDTRLEAAGHPPNLQQN